MLITIVYGAMCFDDLRTIYSTLYHTFREACYVKGLVTIIVNGLMLL